MADATEIIPLEFVRDALKIEGVDPDIDSFLEILIAQATTFVQSYCRRNFLTATYTEFHDGDNGDIIIPRNYPIISVTSVHDDVDRVFGADTLIDSADYAIVADRWIRLIWDVFITCRDCLSFNHCDSGQDQEQQKYYPHKYCD